MGQTQSQCKTHLESLNPPFLVTDIDTSAILQYTPNSDHLSQNISLWCSLSSLNDTSFVPKIGDSSRLRNKSMLSPVVKLFFFFSLACWTVSFSASFRPLLYQKPIKVTTRNISDTSSPGGRWWSQSKHQGCEAVMNHKVDKDCCPHPLRKDFEEGDVIRFILYFILGKVNILIPSNCEWYECKWDLNGIFWTEGIGEGEIGWPA